MSDRLTSQEAATILAALRRWQATTIFMERSLNEIATDMGTLTPLNNDEIDQLCEKINTL
jgi:hypothetical protein